MDSVIAAFSDLAPHLDPKLAVAAGGAVLKYFLHGCKRVGGVDVDGRDWDGDVDLFVSSDWDGLQALLAKLDPDNCRLPLGRYVGGWDGGWRIPPNPARQGILALGFDVVVVPNVTDITEHILNAFDFDVCKTWYDGRTVHVPEKAAVDARRITISAPGLVNALLGGGDCMHDMFSNQYARLMRRVEKYRLRGFSFTNGMYYQALPLLAALPAPQFKSFCEEYDRQMRAPADPARLAADWRRYADAEVFWKAYWACKSTEDLLWTPPLPDITDDEDEDDEDDEARFAKIGRKFSGHPVGEWLWKHANERLEKGKMHSRAAAAMYEQTAEARVETVRICEEAKREHRKAEVALEESRKAAAELARERKRIETLARRALEYARAAAGEEKRALVEISDAVVLRSLDVEACTVCYEEMAADGDGVDWCRRGCGTNFHQTCLRRWRAQGEISCPSCRAPMV